MPRFLACIDPVPSTDGTCQQTAFIDQAGWRDMLPTVEQAGQVGGAIFVGLMTLAVFKSLVFPRRSNDE